MNSNKMSFAACSLFVSVIVSMVSGCYTDDIVDAGEGYGFRIGDAKHESFIKARNRFKGESAYILYPIDSEGFGPHKQVEFVDADYDLIESRDKWEFYFDSGYNNSLELQFSDGVLTNIHRYRKWIELP